MHREQASEGPSSDVMDVEKRRLRPELPAGHCQVLCAGEGRKAALWSGASQLWVTPSGVPECSVG